MTYPVTEEQIRFYEENGFVRLDSVLNLQEVASVRDAVDRATYRASPHIVGDRGKLQAGEEFHGPLFPVIARAAP